jgi:hypothetical protein
MGDRGLGPFYYLVSSMSLTQKANFAKPGDCRLREGSAPRPDLSPEYKPKWTARMWRPTGKREIPYNPGPSKPWDRTPYCLCDHWTGFHHPKDGCGVPGCGCKKAREV